MMRLPFFFLSLLILDFDHPQAQKTYINELSTGSNMPKPSHMREEVRDNGRIAFHWQFETEPEEDLVYRVRIVDANQKRVAEQRVGQETLGRCTRWRIRFGTELC